MNWVLRASAMLGLALIAGACASANAPAPSSGPPPAIVAPAGASAEIAARLNALAENYPGVAFAVAGPSGAAWEGAVGLADVETGAPMSAQTPVSVYSVNKPMTATLAMSLVEAGRLDLDRPIGEIADVPAQFATLTARELLTHTAGVRHYRDGEWLPNSRRACAAPGEAIAAFADDPLGPRGAFQYSSFGYVLLSLVLEGASGEPFHTMMQQRILEPAGMSNASLWQVGQRRPPNGHERAGRRFRTARAIDNSCKFGAGAVIASAQDLARFGAALAGGRLVSDASWRTMVEGVQNNYGLGWGVGALADGAPVAVHSGSAIGGTSVIAVDIQRGVAVAMVGNAEGPSLVDDAKAILMLARAAPDFAE
ncbi:MAG: serine hydrolase domain-containing protein [Hyphomonadaceae bacterium]